MNIKTTYNGNERLRKSGTKIPFTQEQIIEYAKCMDDPIYFIDNYCKIITLDKGLQPFKMYDFQKEFVSLLHENRFVMGMMPRQQSKTTCVAGYMLHYILFNDAVTVAIIANKAAQAREVMSRVQLMYEELPEWLQQGVIEWNKGSAVLENNSKIFTAATSASSIRGKSCLTGSSKVCLEENENIFYTEIDKIINNRQFVEEGSIMDKNYQYTVYKTINKINKKEYIGFHSLKKDHILYENSHSGSCFNSGYLGSGKLIKQAITKYGPENFKQEILGKFYTKEEAEEFEANLVNKDYVLCESNYNICLGGNVRTMVGHNNPFYGKTHTEETVNRIKESRIKNGTTSGAPISFKDKNGNIYRSYDSIMQQFGFSHLTGTKRKEKLAYLLKSGEIEAINNNLIKNSLLNYAEKREQFHNSEEDRYNKLVERMKKPKTEKHKQNIGKSVSNWISNNRDEFMEKMLKINTDPDKKRKTADKHRGMKRSNVTRSRISEALKGKPANNKGKISAINEDGTILKYFDSLEDIPDGWKRGTKINNKGKVAYNNGEICKMFLEGTQPEGWVRGRLSK